MPGSTRSSRSSAAEAWFTCSSTSIWRGRCRTSLWRMAQALQVSTCRVIDFPVVQDQRGNLTFIESGEHVPFEIKRVYSLHDVPGGATRAGPAPRELEQV